jgi:hypothetical protein
VPQVLLHNVRHVGRLHAGIPGFIGLNPHTRPQVALTVAVARHNGYILRQISRRQRSQHSPGAIAVTMHVLTNQDAAIGAGCKERIRHGDSRVNEESSERRDVGRSSSNSS